MSVGARAVRCLAGLLMAVIAAGAVITAAPDRAWAAEETSISGTVTIRSNGATHPAEVATLYLWVWSPYDQEWISTGGNSFTGPGGHYTREVTPGTYKLEVYINGAPATFWGNGLDAQTAPSFTIAPGEQLTDIDIEAQAYGSLRGRVEVKRTAGAPAEPLDVGYVFLERYEPDTGRYEPVPGSAWTLSDGRFEIPERLPGDYALQVIADSQSGIGAEYYLDARYFSDGTDVTVAPGELTDIGVMTLEPRFFDVDRLAGDDRFTTAVEISRFLVPDGERAEVVYIANGYNFPDALAAGPAAIRNGGLILTTHSARLPDAVRAEIVRIDPRRIVIVGGPQAVSPDVAAQLVSAVPGAQVDRLGGADRYETAELVVRDAFAADGADLALIATGRNYPDALAAAGAAAAYDAPVILVDGGPSEVQRALAQLDNLGSTRVVLVGGEAAISSATAALLSAGLPGVDITRIAGADRYDTAARLTGQMVGYSDHAVVASGTGFADALAGGPLAGALGARTYLSPGACIPAGVWDGIVIGQAAGVILLGGAQVLAPQLDQLPVC